MSADSAMCSMLGTAHSADRESPYHNCFMCQSNANSFHLQHILISTKYTNFCPCCFWWSTYWQCAAVCWVQGQVAPSSPLNRQMGKCTLEMQAPGWKCWDARVVNIHSCQEKRSAMFCFLISTFLSVWVFVLPNRLARSAYVGVWFANKSGIHPLDSIPLI